MQRKQQHVDKHFSLNNKNQRLYTINAYLKDKKQKTKTNFCTKRACWAPCAAGINVCDTLKEQGLPK